MDIKVTKVLQDQDGLRREEILINDQTTAYRVSRGYGVVTNDSYFFTRGTSGRYFELVSKNEHGSLSVEEEGELIGIHAKDYTDFCNRFWG